MEKKIKCPYCGRVVWTSIVNKIYCSEDCRWVAAYWAKTHNMSPEEARDHFTAENKRKELERELRKQSKKVKKVVWCQLSSSSGVYRYKEV